MSAADTHADASPPDSPLVSIGIPTYRRAEKLERAVGSVLGQTYSNLEVVISDNASDDGTEAFCRALCEREGRVRYLRSPVNLGPTANFNILFGELRGDYAMLLSDDDWLDHSYIASCLAVLDRAPATCWSAGSRTIFATASWSGGGRLAARRRFAEPTCTRLFARRRRERRLLRPDAPSGVAARGATAQRARQRLAARRRDRRPGQGRDDPRHRDQTRARRHQRRLRQAHRDPWPASRGRRESHTS